MVNAATDVDMLAAYLKRINESKKLTKKEKEELVKIINGKIDAGIAQKK
jgi:ribonuclease HII